MKTAIYIRVSTEEQAKEGYSISAQLQRLKAFCISQGWEVVEIYADEGISAKNMNRPELQRMLKDIENKKIECVLVYRLDRLTRSVFDLYKLLEVFEAHDCKFKSATEVYDTTTAMGRMFITIVAALAQWERENMGERISIGFAEKARQGKYPHNFAPFGYDLNKEESKLYINDKEADTVRLMYELYKNMGSGRVSKELNSRGLYTKEGNRWGDRTTMDVITNPVYYGAIRWVDEIIENTHDAIISKDEWLQTQSIIKDRRNQSPVTVSSNYIFAGKLKCQCGGNMQGYYTTQTKVNGEVVRYYQYRCRNKRNGKCKKSRSISERKLENAFIEILDNVESINFDEVAATVEQNINKKENEIDTDKLKNELDKIERRKKKWQYAWSEDIMSYEDFKKRMAEAKTEEEEIKSLLENTEKTEPEEKYNKDEIINVLKDVRKSWMFLEKHEKKNLVNSIIEQVHVSQYGKHLTIDHIDFKQSS